MGGQLPPTSRIYALRIFQVESELGEPFRRRPTEPIRRKRLPRVNVIMRRFERILSSMLVPNVRIIGTVFLIQQKRAEDSNLEGGITGDNDNGTDLLREGG